MSPYVVEEESTTMKTIQYSVSANGPTVDRDCAHHAGGRHLQLRQRRLRHFYTVHGYSEWAVGDVLESRRSRRLYRRPHYLPDSDRQMSCSTPPVVPTESDFLTIDFRRRSDRRRSTFATGDFDRRSTTLTAYEGNVLIGSNTATGTVLSTFPEGEIAFSGAAFNSVVLVLSTAPTFAIDNVLAAATPEPGSAGVNLIAGLILAGVSLIRGRATIARR